MDRSLAVLEFAVMFEVRFQTYWSEVDGAGIVYFSHFFSFVERAEEELFRAAGKERHLAYEENRVWMPRVEAFSKFSSPIQHGRAIRVQLNPQIRGLKTLRYDFAILDDETRERLAEGYITAVCVDTSNFKSTAIPEPIRKIIDGQTA